MNSLGLLAMLMAVQGQALQLGWPHEAGLTSIEVSWNERQIPYLRVGDEWLTVIGIDLDITAGEYPLEVTLRYEDGRVEIRSDVVQVSGKAFPTTETDRRARLRTAEPGESGACRSGFQRDQCDLLDPYAASLLGAAVPGADSRHDGWQ